MHYKLPILGLGPMGIKVRNHKIKKYSGFQSNVDCTDYSVNTVTFYNSSYLLLMLNLLVIIWQMKYTLPLSCSLSHTHHIFHLILMLWLIQNVWAVDWDNTLVTLIFMVKLQEAVPVRYLIGTCYWWYEKMYLRTNGKICCLHSHESCPKKKAVNIVGYLIQFS